MNTTKTLLLTGFFFLFSFTSNSQIVVDNTTQTPEQLVQNVLTGTGVIVSNVEFNNSVPLAQSIQTQVGYFDATTTTFPITEGLILGTGNVTLAIGPNDIGSATDNNGVATDPNDPDLAQIGSPYTMNNEAILEFDFVPDGDSIVFNYIFASEEYHEYSTSSYNDGFGFIISGPGFAGPFQNGGENIAIVPGTTLPVTMNNLNNGSSNTGPCTNCAYLVDNPPGSPDLQYDAHTTTLQAAASVQCGQTYHIKLVIGDAGDQSFDSAVFLEANSFSSNGVQVEIASATGSAAITEACDSAIVSFIRPTTTDTLDITYLIGGTATNGTDYPFLNGNVTFLPGEDTVQFYIVPIGDAMAEGIETVTITVEIVNACGDTVTSFATVEITDPMPYNVVTSDVLLDCATPTVDITATTDGGVPQFTYDWGTSGTGQTIQVAGDIVGTTTYTVDVVDACGEPSTGTVDVTLTPAPEPTILFDQNTYVICPNEVQLIDATVNNPYDPTLLTYDWQPTGETTEDISVSPNTLTWYYLTINDGCYDVTDSVKVEMGTITLTDIQITDATNCPGQPGTLGSIDVLPDDPTWSYTLIGGGNTIGPQNNGSFANLDGGITYFLNVENTDGCTVDTAVTVGLGSNAVTANWIVDSLRDVTCFGDNSGGAYVNNINGGITAPYDVTWTHTTGLYDSETVSAGGFSEQDNLFGGQWVVTVTDQEGCAWSQLFDIYEPDELVIDWLSNAPTCYQFSDGSVTVNISGGNGGNTINIWDSTLTNLNGGGTTNTANTLPEGWYYASVEDNMGCYEEDSIFIDDPGELDIDLIIEQPLCYGYPTGYAEVDTVYNYTGGYDQISYFWNPNPSAIPNGLGAEWINHLGTGQYSLTINDENGCDKTFSFDIVYPDELITTQLGSEEAYCRQFSYQSGNGVVFVAGGGGTPGYSYLWTNLGTGATSTNSTWGGLNPGDYKIVITDANGCQFIDTLLLDSLNPEASFDVDSPQFLTDGLYEGTAEVCITFTNTSTGFANPFNPNADTTFFWNLSHDPSNPSVGWQISDDYYEVFDTCFTSAGEHDVCLVAINKNGCVDTSCQKMIIYDPLIFKPVNVFTPNNDGDNDFFTFNHWAQGVATFECVIVNRWGVTVHIMNDIADEWDGTDMSGSPLPDGIYYYHYQGVATDGTAFSGQGFTHIVDSGL